MVLAEPTALVGSLVLLVVIYLVVCGITVIVAAELLEHKKMTLRIMWFIIALTASPAVAITFIFFLWLFSLVTKE